MARNEEKAQSMLNRFIAMKQEEERKKAKARGVPTSRRSAECRDLAEADRWRSEVLREIGGAKVAKIQNEGVGEHRLRDLNDEINRLLRERGHWERRIVELGGPTTPLAAADASAPLQDDRPRGRHQAPEAKKPRSLYAIYRRVDASYYGHRDGNDDEDGVLDSFEGEGEGKGDVGDAADEEREFVAHVPLPDEKRSRG
uniref:Pre-mRNA-splicing factor ISY n=1 Tax=Ananas comosus var. bracteatus TaxID=296719 RepID=A0A6V7PAI9_ANACO|nr:unnamed protein product [Ananas comosus var. bracteatus]